MMAAIDRRWGPEGISQCTGHTYSQPVYLLVVFSPHALRLAKREPYARAHILNAPISRYELLELLRRLHLRELPEQGEIIGGFQRSGDDERPSEKRHGE